MKTIKDAISSLDLAWPVIKEECLSVLGSELHYQAMVYNGLRTIGKIPISQLGMNVKMWIENPVSELFKKLDEKKHADFQGGFEPIPDVVIFKPDINGDWRRRNRDNTLTNMLVAIEVKASERKNGRLRPKEVIYDIEKLAAHREEVRYLNSDMYPIMMVIDSAPLEIERMTKTALESVKERATELDVGLMYCSPSKDFQKLDVT